MQPTGTTVRVASRRVDGHTPHVKRTPSRSSGAWTSHSSAMVASNYSTRGQREQVKHPSPTTTSELTESGSQCAGQPLAMRSTQTATVGCVSQAVWKPGTLGIRQQSVRPQV